MDKGLFLFADFSTYAHPQDTFFVRPPICAFGVGGGEFWLLKGFITQGPLLSGFWLEFGQW